MLDEKLREVAAAYFASPKGQALIRTFLSSPEGKEAIDAYLATPEGQQMAFLLLGKALDRLEIPDDAKEIIRTALAGKSTA
jgi:hypothetical protein